MILDQPAALQKAQDRAAQNPAKRKYVLPVAAAVDPNPLTGAKRYADRLRSDLFLRILLGIYDGQTISDQKLREMAGQQFALQDLLEQLRVKAYHRPAELQTNKGALTDGVPEGASGGAVLLDGSTLTSNGQWSKAALLQGAIESISAHTSANRSIAFVVDADLVARNGLFPSVIRNTALGSAAFVPVLWSTCFNATLDDLPADGDVKDSGSGFWRTGGTGMVAAFASDILAVNGYNAQFFSKSSWGSEDIDFTKRLRQVVALNRPRTPSLVHLYHQRVDWAASVDGIRLAVDGFNGELCVSHGSCVCPPGSTLEDLVRAAELEAVDAVRAAQQQRNIDFAASVPLKERADALIKRWQHLLTFLNEQQREALEQEMEKGTTHVANAPPRAEKEEETVRN